MVSSPESAYCQFVPEEEEEEKEWRTEREEVNSSESSDEGLTKKNICDCFIGLFLMVILCR